MAQIKQQVLTILRIITESVPWLPWDVRRFVGAFILAIPFQVIFVQLGLSGKSPHPILLLCLIGGFVAAIFVKQNRQSSQLLLQLATTLLCHADILMFTILHPYAATLLLIVPFFFAREIQCRALLLSKIPKGTRSELLVYLDFSHFPVSYHPLISAVFLLVLQLAFSSVRSLFPAFIALSTTIPAFLFFLFASPYLSVNWSGEPSVHPENEAKANNREGA